jgi:branched-chain amino acid transport system substrate-binding protein
MNTLNKLLLAALVSGLSLTSMAQTKPTELKIGITTFMSGPASVFGVPAKAAAELMIEDINAQGGIGGVKLSATYIDEGAGADKMLSEYRRVVQEMGVKTMLASISSGNCNIVAPVAEDLKVLNIAWDCGTEKLLEEKRYQYVVRTQANATTEMVATVLYLMKTKPDFETIAVVNQDYAWGRDSWEIFINTLRVFKPNVKVVAEMFPKMGAADFSTELSRLQAIKPDVVLNTSWGGDLDTFVRQASQRGVFGQKTLFVLPLLESSLERLGSTVPAGIIAGARGDETARIFTSCLEAELISIAGTYRTSDTPLPKEVAGKAAQISLQGDKLVMQRL